MYLEEDGYQSYDERCKQEAHWYFLDKMFIGDVEVTRLPVNKWPVVQRAEEETWWAWVDVECLVRYLGLDKPAWWVWGKPVMLTEIEALPAIVQQGERRPYSWDEKWSVEDHQRRIRSLMATQDWPPIELEFGEGPLLQDGHHRLAAAWLRGDAFIRAEIIGFANVVLEHVKP